MSKGLSLHRKRHHRHALDRLIERYDSRASIEDIDRLWRKAETVYQQHGGESVDNTPLVRLNVYDAEYGKVPLWYHPRHNAIATIVPKGC